MKILLIFPNNSYTNGTTVRQCLQKYHSFTPTFLAALSISLEDSGSAQLSSHYMLSGKVTVHLQKQKIYYLPKVNYTDRKFQLEADYQSQHTNFCLLVCMYTCVKNVFKRRDKKQSFISPSLAFCPHSQLFSLSVSETEGFI